MESITRMIGNDYMAGNKTPPAVRDRIVTRAPEARGAPGGIDGPSGAPARAVGRGVVTPCGRRCRRCPTLPRTAASSVSSDGGHATVRYGRPRSRKPSAPDRRRRSADPYESLPADADAQRMRGLDDRDRRSSLPYRREPLRKRDRTAAVENTCLSTSSLLATRSACPTHRHVPRVRGAPPDAAGSEGTARRSRAGEHGARPATADSSPALRATCRYGRGPSFRSLAVRAGAVGADCSNGGWIAVNPLRTAVTQPAQEGEHGASQPAKHGPPQVTPHTPEALDRPGTGLGPPRD